MSQISHSTNDSLDQAGLQKADLYTDSPLIRVGDWNVSPDTCTVTRLVNGEPCETGVRNATKETKETKVTPRSMDVLRLLIDRAGAVVSPAEFLATIWPSRIATDHAIHKAIAELRSALHDSAHQPRYIKTIPKRGYSLIAPVQIISPSPAEDAEGASAWHSRTDEQRIAATTGRPSTQLPTGSPTGQAVPAHHNTDTAPPDQPPAGKQRAGLWPRIALAAALVLALVATPLLLQTRDVVPEADSVLKLAVVPFTARDFSDDNQILADGIREALTHGLSKLAHLQVLSPPRHPELVNAAFSADSAYLRDADHILQGSVTTFDGRLRVLVQLVRVSDGLSEYSDQFDLPLDDIFAVQDEIVSNVVSALRIYLNDHERSQMQDWGTTNALAYERFLRGEFHNNQFNPPDWERAMAYHRAAIELDPAFLNAYHGLATAANNLAVYSGTEKIEQMYQVVLDIHRQISLLDPESDILDSLHAIKLRMRGSSYVQQERQMREQILSRDPPPFVMAHYALLLIGARMYDEAIRYLNLTSEVGPYEISPDEAWSYRINVLTPTDAIAARKQQLQQRPFHVGFVGSLAVNLAMLGDFRQAQIYLNQQQELDTEGILFHQSQIVTGYLAGDIRRDDDSYQKALIDHPDFYYNNGVLAFMLGDMEAGIQYWQSLQPAQLRRLFNVTHSVEKYFPDHILESPAYHQLLDQLGAGLQWQRRLMEGVMAMEHITGVGLSPQSQQAYDAGRLMLRNNYWSDEDWLELEHHKSQRLGQTSSLTPARVH